ncbi:MAG: Cof-type HAD-IIB family hydrolase [Acutalibacteraceae bacterium]|nr:Cof-type HAD-IIB family hydrolase [Acutalibacteraceae bacterium]
MVENKKSLSNWLIASDIDGTINNKARQLVQRNYDAVHKYINEYGGNFTLASGRAPESMRKHFKRLDIPDGKAIVINGAGIYDFAEEKMIWSSPLNEHCIDIVRKTVKKYPTISFQVISDKYVYIFRPTPSSRILAINAKLPIKYFYSFEAIPKDNWYKVIFTGIPPALKSLSRYVESMSNTTENLMFSSQFSYEIVNEDTNKGKAVLKLAEMLGVDKENTAAIGDYFNDYEMLKQVALPACCGQAPKGMKKIAKLVTCHCDRGAVADLIEFIIKNHSNK